MATPAELAEKLKMLHLKRGSIKGTVTRCETYFNSITEDSFHESEINERKSKLENAWQQFEDVQFEIELLDEASGNHEIERANFENSFYKTKGKANQLLIDYSTKQNINRIGSSVNTRNTPLETQIRLPKINLPTFSGAYEEWYPFFETFQSLIDKNATISEIQKFHYRKSSLLGESAEIIQNLEITGENYTIAWDILKNRYDNKRVIVNNHIKAIFEIQSIYKENLTGLRQLVDGVSKHMRALKALKRPTEFWDDLVIHVIISKLDYSTIREWEKTLDKSTMPILKDMTTFLEQKVLTLEAIAKKPTPTYNTSNKINFNKGMTHVSTRGNCPICNQEHLVYNCDIFGKMSVNQRLQEIKSKGLCLNCLKSTNHMAYECRGNSCRKCNRRHNTLLHYTTKINEVPHIVPQSIESTASTSQVQPNQVLTTVVNHSTQQQATFQILLATALVNIYDVRGKQHLCRALLDSGSQSHFLTEACANKLGLPLRETPVDITGISSTSTKIGNSVEIRIKSRLNEFQTKMNCLVLRKITEPLPSVSFSKSSIKIPPNIKLADPNFNKSSAIDLLIGAELFWDLMCVGQIKEGRNQPCLQKTQLGWVISGRLIRNNHAFPVSCNLAINDALGNQLEKFWTTEEFTGIKTLTLEEQECENHFSTTFRRNNNGRFIVQLPTKGDNLSQLGESKQMATKRFLSLEKRLNRQPNLKQEYGRFISEYIELGHMKLITHEEHTSTPHFYLPHHAVFKESSSTTKLRVVFDGSAKSSTGISLNDTLMVGPTLQQDLFSIVARFRTFKYALTADIEKMYRQVLVDGENSKLQRILWRDNIDQNINTYELQTVTYGTAPASFLAIRSLQQLAMEEENTYKTGSKIIIRDFYLDDLLTGANTKADAIKIRNETTLLLKKGGFALRKWGSNCRELLDDILESTTGECILTLDETGSIKTLGLQWCSNRDTLQYSVPRMVNANRVTKRHILSRISQLFDPLGLVGPIIIKAKIIMQQLWTLKIDWDESVPINIHTNWLQYEAQLSRLSELNIPRRVIEGDCSGLVEIHGFCDASQEAYGACIYIRSKDSEGNYAVKLLCAKSRVAPLKNISLPRLELCGALLLSRLLEKTTSVLAVKITNVSFWTDSTIALAWIRSSSKTWNTFVANRVSEIQHLTNSAIWGHVSTVDNPADMLSRGLTSDQLISCKIWWNGPSWLMNDSRSWTTLHDTTTDVEVVPERRKVVVILATKKSTLWDKYSNITRLIRVVGFCLRFKTNALTAKENRIIRPTLTANEISNATKVLVKLVQSEEFIDEIRALRKHENVHKSSKLLSLTPFLDEDGILRVGGRLRNSNLHFATKHPILLPASHSLTKLLIQREHQRQLHAGAHATLAAIRNKYWPLAGMNTVKGIIRNCLKCFKVKPVTVEHIMGNLPADRLQPTRPFLNCGIDYCGPFFIKESRRKSAKLHKAYGAIFVCFSTKAVHIELVSDLTTEAFIACLKRFMARRGKICNLYSDNATNFVGANRELKRLQELFNSQLFQMNLTDFLAADNIKWHFSPPKSPHFGGLWEAAVKSTKNHLKRIAGQASLTFEGLYTLLTQIEAVLNSRPLIPISNDPNDLSCLTPSHFIIGDSLVNIVEPNITAIPSNRLSHWQRIEQLRQHFWSRWSKEYLHRLQERTKWKTTKGTQLEAGQLVIIREDNAPPLIWVMGRIEEVHPGSDGVVRAATVRTAKNTLKRAANKLCVLPFQN